MSATSIMMPLPASVQKMLTELLGKSVTVKKIPMGDLSSKPGVAANYVYDGGDTGAVMLCDLAMSSYAGAALMLLPPAAAVTSVKAGKLDDTIVENVREVLNILASLFIFPERPHVRLRDVHPLPGTAPPEVGKIMTKPAARMDVEVTIAGYGTGRMALLTA